MTLKEVGRKKKQCIGIRFLPEEFYCFFDLFKVSKMTNYYDLFKANKMSNFYDLFKVSKKTILIMTYLKSAK